MSSAPQWPINAPRPPLAIDKADPFEDRCRHGFRLARGDRMGCAGHLAYTLGTGPIDPAPAGRARTVS